MYADQQPTYRRPIPLSTAQEETSELLVLAAVLPEQFYGPPPNVHAGRPELALMRAVLEDAVCCFQKQFVSTGRRAQRLAREAEEWFFTDDYSWPYSFLHLCTALGLNPEYIRRGLRRWCQQRPTTFLKRKRRVVVPPRLFKVAA